MSWTYLDHQGTRITRQQWEQAYAADGMGRETVGERELMLMLRARASATGTVCLGHTRQQNAARMAARRLVARGLLNEPNAMHCPRGFDNPAAWLYFYTLTEKGAACWLRSREKQEGEGR